MVVITNNKLYYNIEKGKVRITEEFKSVGKMIVTNDALKINQTENVIDIHILRWLKDNFYKADHRINTEDSKSVLSINDEYKQEFVNLNPSILDQAFEYTRMYQIFNSNHEFEVNRNYYLTLKEYFSYNLKLKEKANEYMFSENEELMNITKKIRYDFVMPSSKITNRGFNLAKIDRKSHMELFKKYQDKNYYLVDFKNFEPSMINYYIPDYITEDFYDKWCAEIGIDREKFKEMFIAWLNGATESVLGELKRVFEDTFIKIEELRNSMSKKFINYFGHEIYCDKDYKKLGYLIQSTGGDLLKRLHVKIHELKPDFKIVWTLFDELLIYGDINEFRDFIKDLFPILTIKVTEV